MSDFKLLTFLLGEETYGIPISKIREIISMHTITPIPHSANYLKGIINLRGTVIPVVDLRKRLGLQEKEYDTRTCILIVNIDDAMGKQGALGVIVDVVSEVINMSDEQVADAPSCGIDRGTNNIVSGIGKLQNKNLIILDVDKMFADGNVLEVEIPEEETETELKVELDDKLIKEKR